MRRALFSIWSALVGFWKNHKKYSGGHPAGFTPRQPLTVEAILLFFVAFVNIILVFLLFLRRFCDICRFARPYLLTFAENTAANGNRFWSDSKI